MAPRFNGIGMTSQRTRERLIKRLRELGIRNEDVLAVMRATPRHIFLDEALAHRAYEDTALPIGYSQTLSQPYIVARMTELLLTHGIPKRVLEIGSGSGYQTAILARLVGHVFAVERIKPLLEKSRQRLRELGLRNVTLSYRDGGIGWPEKAPFDAILAAAAPERIPAELLDQLGPNGILVMPVGPDGDQWLRMVCRKGSSDNFEDTRLEAVRFVPLMGGTSNG